MKIGSFRNIVLILLKFMKGNQLYDCNKAQLEIVMLSYLLSVINIYFMKVMLNLKYKIINITICLFVNMIDYSFH